MRSQCTIVLFIVLTQSLNCSEILKAPDSLSSANALRTVADAVRKDATFDFFDSKDGRVFASTSEAPASAQLQPKSRYNDWRYWNGVLNIAMIRLGVAFNDTNYARFADQNIAFSFNNSGFFRQKYHGEGKWNYPFGQFFTMEELDDCGAMGASVIDVYSRNKQGRYKNYLDLAANHIEKVQARLDDGTLVRSFPRHWTVWADDLYMSISFLSRMGELTADARYFDDAARQVLNFHKYLFDAEKQLMYHCWYSDTRNHGVAFWGRANGWSMLAQADLLDRLPRNHRDRDTLIALFRRDIAGIVRYQSEDGMWHQLLDKPDSFEETSCSAMFVYAVARAIDKGYIDVKYAPIAQRAWRAILNKIRPNGDIEGVCTGTGVGEDLKFYYTRPAPTNDVHGIGAVLLAGTEVMQLTKLATH